MGMNRQRNNRSPAKLKNLLIGLYREQDTKTGYLWGSLGRPGIFLDLWEGWESLGLSREAGNL